MFWNDNRMVRLTEEPNLEKFAFTEYNDAIGDFIKHFTNLTSLSIQPDIVCSIQK